MSRQRGFSVLELVVSICLVAVFAAVLLERLLYLEEYAEMTAMDLTVARMQSGLRNRFADLLIRDKVSDIAALADDNPVEWLDTHPENYLGEFDWKPNADLRGKWYFDRKQRELVYTINLGRHFLPLPGGATEFRWHAVKSGVREENKSVNKTNAQWVSLMRVAGGRWF
jgi:type II secretory pathway pseudopilin PulG